MARGERQVGVCEAYENELALKLQRGDNVCFGVVNTRGADEIFVYRQISLMVIYVVAIRIYSLFRRHKASGVAKKKRGCRRAAQS